MAVVVSTYFRNIAFPFQGGITIVNQQNFLPNGSQVTGSIPMIHGSPHLLQNIRVGLLKDPILMGTFAPSTSNQFGGSSVSRNLQYDIFKKDLRKRYRHGSCAGFSSKPNKNIVAINVPSMGGKPKSTLIKRLDK